MSRKYEWKVPSAPSHKQADERVRVQNEPSLVCGGPPGGDQAIQLHQGHKEGKERRFVSPVKASVRRENVLLRSSIPNSPKACEWPFPMVSERMLSLSRPSVLLDAGLKPP